MCDYCKPNDNSMLASANVIDERIGNIHVSSFIGADTLFTSANFLTVEVKINYCPMCGEKLNANIES